MHNVRDFRLVLCADVLDCAVDNCVETLERIAEEAEDGLDHLLHKSLIICERRTHRIYNAIGKLDASSGRDNSASAL